MNLESLQKLYVHELKDLYSAETQLVEALPKMVEASRDAELRTAFEEHLAETKEQVRRLEQIFASLDFEPGGHRCKGMEGLIKEGNDVLGNDIDEKVVDAALIAAAQRVEHYEMAGYGTARAYAEKLGEYAAADLLQTSLNEESLTDQKLTRLAERSINFKAMAR
jgi:ferritin-like metal-binding protein YciE